MDLNVDIARTTAELDRLAQFSDVPSPAVQRVVFTPTDLAARSYLIELFEEAGLQVRVDPIGNIFARWEGTDPSLPAVATGSHTDAIPYSGKYDGTVGVLGGLEAIRTLQRAMQADQSKRAAGFIPAAPRRSIELVMFTSEEPTRFAYGCLGSRLLSGQLSPDAAAKLTDADGQNLDDVRRTAGVNGSLADVKLKPGHYSAFAELHIERKGSAASTVGNLATSGLALPFLRHSASRRAAADTTISKTLTSWYQPISDLTETARLSASPTSNSSMWESVSESWKIW